MSNNKKEWNQKPKKKKKNKLKLLADCIKIHSKQCLSLYVVSRIKADKFGGKEKLLIN